MPEFIRYSGRGVRFGGTAYVVHRKRGAAHNCVPGSVNPYENATAEGFESTRKRDELYLLLYLTFHEAQSTLRSSSRLSATYFGRFDVLTIQPESI